MTNSREQSGPNAAANPNIYTPGGTVQANQEGLYIRRAADEELWQLCQRGDYAYVLTSRQMGKSSLMVATANRLREAEDIAIIVDLTDMGVEGATSETWYRGFLLEIEDKLEQQDIFLETDVYTWWDGQDQFSITQRFTRFFRDVLLPEVEGRVVVFVDEIDTTLGLTFTDDFFIAIRSFYTARAQAPEFHRLSFVLIGVATPGSLILDARRTPFNIGQRVDLTDFTLAEALNLATGLAVKKTQQPQVFERILHWTGGHPYLTQRLCIELSRQELPKQEGTRQKPFGWTERDIDEVITRTFLGDCSERDSNLQFVQGMLIEPEKAPDVFQVLTTYQDVWRTRRPVEDEEQSIVKAHLKLAGVVKRDSTKCLQVRNKIYCTVFDERWVKDHLPFNWRKRLRQLQGVIAAGLVVTVSSTGLAGWALWERGKADALAEDLAFEKNQALEQSREREDANKELTQALKELDAEKKRAEEEQAAAEAAEQIAKNQRSKAEIAQQNAEVARQIAEKQRLRAEAGEADAIQQEQRALENQAIAEQQADIAERQAINANVLAQRVKTDSLYQNNSFELEALMSGVANAQNIFQHYSKIGFDIKIQSALSLQRVIYSIQEKNRFEGHTDLVRDLHFSPDGQTIASASFDQTVRLWGLDGIPIATLEGHTDGITNVRFSPDGQTIASTSLDRTVRLWQLDGTHIATLKDNTSGAGAVHGDGVRDVSFSPDGQIIASTTDHGAVHLWHLDGTLIRSLEGHTHIVTAVSFSPDGQTIASTSHDGTVRLWQLDGTPIATLEGHAGDWVTSVSFSPDGQTIISTGHNNTVSLWQLDGTPIVTLESRHPLGSQVIFSPDSQMMALLSDNLIELWRLDGTLIANLEGSAVHFNPDDQMIALASEKSLLRLHRLNGNPIITLVGRSLMRLSPDGQMIASASADGTVRLWSLNGTPTHVLKGDIGRASDVRFSSDGQTIATAAAGGRLNLWQLNGTPIHTLERNTGVLTSSFGAEAVSFSPDGQTVASISNDSTVRLWKLDGTVINTPLTPFYVNSMRSSPDGKTLVFFNYQGAMHLLRWNGTQVSILYLPFGISDVRFSPDGQTIASVHTVDNVIHLWRLDGTHLNTIEVPSESGRGPIHVRFSPNGQTIATARNDGKVHLWRLDGTQIATRKGHTSSINDIHFSPDGQTIASAHDDGTLRLWHLDGTQIAMMEGHKRSVNDISFSNDGQMIVSASSDDTLRLWHLDGTQIAMMEGHTGPISKVRFSPDDQTIASTSPDGTVRLWNLNLEDLMEKGCAWLHDYLVTSSNVTPENRAICPRAEAAHIARQN